MMKMLLLKTGTRVLHIVLTVPYMAGRPLADAVVVHEFYEYCLMEQETRHRRRFWHATIA